jgi:phosphoglycolate phosphatase
VGFATKNNTRPRIEESQNTFERQFEKNKGANMNTVLHTVKAVIFDLDGTLLYSLEDLADSVNAVLNKNALPEHPLDDYRTFVGDGMKTLVARAAPTVLLDEAFHSEIVAAVRDEYALRWKAKSRPYPGIPELLDACGERGIARAVLSNKPHEFTQRIMDEIFADWSFEVVAGAKPGVPLKPDPTAALKIAEELDLKPAEVLFLGDSDVDINTAKAAGMLAVGALWGYRGKEELEAAGAKALVKDALEILDLIAK